MIKVKFLRTFLLFAIVFSSFIGFAQPCSPDPCPDPPPDPGDPVPITGIELLLAGGALLGFRKLVKNEKKSQ